MTTSDKTKKRKHIQTNIRLTENEMERLKEDSDKLGKSIPALLKENYFQGLPTKVLMRKDDKNLVLRQIRAIGNNMNQIAKKVNSGASHGWVKHLKTVSETLEELSRYIGHGYGLHQN